MSHDIDEWVRRMDMGARHQVLGDRYGLRVRLTGPQQFRQKMGMRALGALAVRRWDRPEHLDASEPTGEDAMRAYLRHRSTERIAGREQRPPAPFPEVVDDGQIGGTYAHVNLQGAEPEIEEDRRAILWTNGIAVRTKFGQDRVLIARTT